LKVLMVDKYFFIKGGAERYLFEVKDIFENHGHQVIPFSMKHERNFETSYDSYFVENIEFNQASAIKKMILGFQSLGRVLYSTQARNRIQKLINETKPDIAHIHMIDHQISPSILPVLKKADIPVIQTVHTYKRVCPSYRLFHMGKGEICEKCLDHHYYHTVFEKCHKNSFWASFILMLEAYLHTWMSIYDKHIDCYHVPSHFMGQKLIEGGVPPEKVKHLFYTINLDDYPVHLDSENYFVYFGRLSKEKGLFTLLKAMQGVEKSELHIIGDGPLKSDLEHFIKKYRLKNVKMIGRLQGDALKFHVSRSRFVVVPSEWYENSPLVIYESLAMGKPVIGSKIGGIPELIQQGKNGYVFDAGNVQQLQEKIDIMLNKSDLIGMGQCAREAAERTFSPENHYAALLSLYQSILE